jgi:RNA-directed DNA polymerase
MLTSLHAIAQAARKDEKRRFRHLYRELNKPNLTEAFHALRKDAAAGVDGVTWREYEKNLEANVDDLVERLKRKRFRAKLVRRTVIPKQNGKMRPLGIPALEDKMVQWVVREVLEVLYEPLFLPVSFGYRSGLSARKAAEELREQLRNECIWVVEADIKSFFDTIDHEVLIGWLEKRIDDGPFIRIIRKWLKAGILHRDGTVERPQKGTPQGSIISPMLANIYLHYVLDQWFEKKHKPGAQAKTVLVRYADDFVAAFRYHADAARFLRALKRRMKQFGLQLAEEKTRKFMFNRFRKKASESFDFLGFEYRWINSRRGRDIIRMRTSRKTLRRIALKFKLWCKSIRNKRIQWIMGMVKTKIRGHIEYFGVKGNSASLRAMYHICVRTLYKWLNRRSERKSLNWKTFSGMLMFYGIFSPKIRTPDSIQLSLLPYLC